VRRCSFRQAAGAAGAAATPMARAVFRGVANRWRPSPASGRARMRFSASASGCALARRASSIAAPAPACRGETTEAGC